MNNPYQPPPLYSGSERVHGGWFLDFLSHLPTLSIAYAAWLVWVWFVSYDPRYSGSDGLGMFLFSAVIGVFAGKLYRGAFRMRIFVALLYSALPVILMISYQYFVTQVPMKPVVALVFVCIIWWLGALAATYAIAKLFQLLGIGWSFLRRWWRTAASLDLDSRTRSAGVAILSQRLVLVYLPLVLFQVLENAVLTVRIYWFHDFAFIDPWLWFTAPIAFGLTTWAFQPICQGCSRFRVAIASAVAVVIAGVLLLLAVPFGYAIASLLDESAKPETRWKVCNFMIAFAWFYSGFVREFVEQNAHVNHCNFSNGTP